MSDMQFHHDINGEALHRRHREADEWVRSRSLQRDARSARDRLAAPSSRRLRVMAVASPMVALLALAVAGGFIG